MGRNTHQNKNTHALRMKFKTANALGIYEGSWNYFG